jgi:signal peptidase I
MASTVKKQRSGLGGFVELIVTVAIAVGLAFLIQAFIVKPYRIPSVSMYPTLHVGQRILVNRLSTHPKIGDIVVFHPPAGSNNDADPICGDPSQGTGHQQACDRPTAAEASDTFVKRVVAVGGDTLKIIDGHAYVNGKEERGSYIQSCDTGAAQCTFRQTIKIPPGHYFMMGDNRGESDDSRYWGPVPQKWIIGVAFFTYWPPGRVGTL